MMKQYLVVSPQYEVTIPILDDGTGPTEYCSDAVLVNAKSKREAIKLAVKSPEFRQWVKDAREAECNPFIGIKAYDYDQTKEHLTEEEE